jgi:predicted site-specific integrase-resolvase
MKLYTDKEFCELMRITRVTAGRWREQGIVSYIKLPNGAVRYSEEHVLALIASAERKAA